ncbi:MAG: glucans biosynthesis glucosyltransferase MdoH [Pseudomonadota bacterium]
MTHIFAQPAQAHPNARYHTPNQALTLRWRRWTILVVNLLTVGALTAAMIALLAPGGWSLAKIGMMAAYVTTLPWLSIGFWNAVIGFGLLARDTNPMLAVNPDLADIDETDPITTRTAVVMAIRNEDPAVSIGRLRAIFADLDRTGVLSHFDFHVLSDTTDPKIATREEEIVARWQREAGRRGRIHYRRRTSNEGFKAGNIEEFCDRHVDDYDYFLPLDADSFMSAKAILRLVRALQQNPRIGLLQGLVVGAPAVSFFTRTFQFGMRHGMRAFTIGSAWWQGDCGPYWGHNALIRIDVFARHCRLEKLPGEGPLGGYILSHDQVEAVLMRRAGYEVRVLATEDESWEENPPSLPDFIRRELRWCQGNMQYWQLLAMPNTPLLSRVQLFLAILMYLSPVAWMAFLALGTINVATMNGEIGAMAGWGIALFALILTMSLMPKLMGLASILINARQRKRYGGAMRIAVGGAIELVMSMLMAPIVGFSIAVFAVGLLLGRKLEWTAQQREPERIRWSEAVRMFWLHTLAGITMTALVALHAPSLLIWGAPVLLGFTLAIPFAVATSSRTAARISCATGICNIPEDRRPPLPLRRLLGEKNNPTQRPLLADTAVAGAEQGM